LRDGGSRHVGTKIEDYVEPGLPVKQKGKPRLAFEGHIFVSTLDVQTLEKMFLFCRLKKFGLGRKGGKDQESGGSDNNVEEALKNEDPAPRGDALYTVHEIDRIG